MAEGRTTGSELHPSSAETRERLMPGDNSNRIIRRHGASVHRQHRISEIYYGDSQDEDNAPGDGQRQHGSRFPEVTFGRSLQQSYNIKTSHTKQSRRLPVWVWYLLTRFLGIRLHPNDKPICGTLMHAVTLTFALGYVVTFTWYTVYDIMSKYTKQTVLTGMVAIMIVVFWCALGIYAHKLASKLFSSQKFVESVRLHTRTVFKISAAGLMVLIATTATVLNNYSAASIYSGQACRNITVSPAVCYTLFSMRVGYSAFSLLWNLLVGIVLLSVCRTHTIGIRRFIKQLEDDGRIYELYMRNLYNPGPMGAARQSDLTEITDDELHYEWDDEDLSPLSEDYHIVSSVPPSPSASASSPSRQRHSPTRLQEATRPTHDLYRTNSSSHNLEAQGSSTGSGIVGNVGADGETNNVQPKVDQLIDLKIDHVDVVLPPTGINSDPAGSTSVTMTTASAGGGRSPGHMIAEPLKPRPFRPENRPIIIIKEGSIANSEENDLDLPLHDPPVTSNLRPDGAIPLVRQDGRCVDQRQDGRCEAPTQDGCPEVPERSPQMLVINPDPPSYASRSTQHSMRVELSSPRRLPSSMAGGSDDTSSSIDNVSESPKMLSLDNILLCYWRISCRLRSTSLALQRWLMAWVTFILAWSFSFIVSWVHHEATLLEIAAFVLPMLLLPLVCSAYGEVNMEGKRMTQCVCPTEERVHMLLYLERQPLQLTAFGFPVNYSTIVKTVGALGAAFCTKIILEEFSVFK